MQNHKDILPSQCRDFMDKQYWKRFFKKLKKQKADNEYFEWYGDYQSFDHLFKQFIKPEDQIIHVGIGKSLLSEQLYDQGIAKHILNVDFEKQSLEQMRLRSEVTRPEQSFKCLSLVDEMQFVEQFDVIIDKGTLDAIYPDAESLQVIQYLENMHKILKVNGKFIIISLLQEHILEIILQQSDKYTIQIFETIIKDSKLYPYFIVLTKGQPNNKILIRKIDQTEDFYSIQQSKQLIKKLQLQNNFVTQIHKLRQAQSYTMDLWQANKKQNPRFTLYIYDNDNADILQKRTCACFIIPQGRESGFLFGTKHGHQELIKQVGVSRLVIVRLNPGHKFENLKIVQHEITPVMQDLIPKKCTNIPVPYMTDGDEIGQKNILYESEESIIEEVQIEEANYRRLIFKNCLDLVQCQVRLNKDKVDQTYLDFEAHLAMVAGLGFAGNNEVLILGGGVGLLGKFLTTHLQAKVTNLEISDEIIKIGKIFFELDDVNQNVVNCDALDYIEQILNCKQFGAVIIDINSSEQNTISPPQQFISEKFLEKIRTIIIPEGIIIINILDPLKQIKKLPWDLYFSRKCENEINEVHYLINTKIENNQLDKQILDNLNQKLKKYQSFLTTIKTWDSSLNIPNEINDIKLKHPLIKQQAFQIQETLIVEDGQVKDARKDFYQDDLAKIQKKKKNKRRKNR